MDLKESLKYKSIQMRRHIIQITTKAGSGHPTSSMSAADIMAVLFFHEMRHDPSDPSNPYSDKFILSKGHAAPGLYVVMAESGYFPLEELTTLRETGSRLEGHPTTRLPGVIAATGALGQGLSLGIGLALAGKLDGLDYRVYVLMGDGEINEGQVWEALLSAPNYKLDNLCAIIDRNRLQQSAWCKDIMDTEPLKEKLEAFRWRVREIDGHDFDQILDGFEFARSSNGGPTMLLAKTVKGKGVSFTEDVLDLHGKALSKEEEKRALEELALPDYGSGRPVFSIKRPSPKDIQSRDPSFDIEKPEYDLGYEIATREAYGRALAKMGRVNPRIVVLDGDVSNSTFSNVFKKEFEDRFFDFGIAEQNMISAAVGFAKAGKIAFANSFGRFFERAYDQIEMAAYSRANIKVAGSHCGVSIGEDGVSQMALADLSFMRAIPDSVVLCGSDGVSAERLTVCAAQHQGFVYIRNSRPKTPVIYGKDEEFYIGGAKVIRKSEDDQITLAAAGYTVTEALKAYEELKKEGINVKVIDAYSIKPVAKDLLVQAVASTGGSLITVDDHYIVGGLGDALMEVLCPEGIAVHKMGIESFPESGKADELLYKFGIGWKNIVDKVKALVEGIQ